MRKDLETRLDALLAQMTLAEKASLLAGKDIWHTTPIERLGIPSVVMTDGPHGVRAANPEVGRQSGPATAFPSGISMAASWNTDLIERVGQALAEETRGMGCDILLGPCVNIIRYPLAGRSFESFSEDPYLAGRIAVAYIRGLQSRGVGASLKHYAVNNYEEERFRASSNVDERTLREIYLAQFEMAVKEAQPWTVMCSYNRVNGVYASEHAHLLREILKEEWGFQGALISDWGATHNGFQAVAAGLDLEMPGPAKYLRLVGEAVANWQIDPSLIDDAARRVLRLVFLSGRMDGKVAKGAVNTPAHQRLARELAEEAITLLKNEGEVLPLADNVRSIAVLGPNAAEAVIEGGGSSRVEPPYRISPLEALQNMVGKQVRLVHERGCDNYDEPFDVPLSWLGGKGLKAEFFATPDFQGEPLATREDTRPEFWHHVNWSAEAWKPLAARWSGTLTLPQDGLYRFVLRHAGHVRLYLDDRLILESEAGQGSPAKAERLLRAGAHGLRLEYVRREEEEIIAYRLGLGQVFPAGEDRRLEQAVELARRCDVALIFAGYPEGYESEGVDRPHMDLLGGQNALIEAVAAVNPKTVVVLNVGAPVTMPWADKVAAILLAYYPGQENGNAVARVLLGKVNPSGKLPVTFPRRLQDSPAYLNRPYPGCREVNYGEGIFVGYRYFDHAQVEPLFPFGHGLSYTTFQYSDLRVPKRVKKGQPVVVSLKVKNTGAVAGKEVVQLYVADETASVPRPPKELKAFAKVELKPGQSTEVTFTLEERVLSFYNPYGKSWVAEEGKFDVLIGSSSRDIRLRGSFMLTG